MSKLQKDYYPEAATRELFVGNLAKGAEVLFKDLNGFSYFQPDRMGRPYGFIGFKTAEQCDAALEELTGKVFNRRIIEVRRPNSYIPPKNNKMKKIQQKIANKKFEEEEVTLIEIEKKQEYNDQLAALKYFEEQKKIHDQKEKDHKILELQQKLEYYEKRDQEIIAQQLYLQQAHQQEQIRQEQMRQEQMRQEQIRQEQIRQEQMRQEQMRQEQMRQEQIRQQRLREEEEWQKWVENEKLKDQLKIQQEKIQLEQIEKQKLVENLQRFNQQQITADQFSLIQEMQTTPEIDSERKIYFALKEMKSISGLQIGSTAEMLYNVLYYKYRHYNLLGI